MSGIVNEYRREYEIHLRIYQQEKKFMELFVSPKNNPAITRQLGLCTSRELTLAADMCLTLQIHK
jgi:hypothetical protein